MKKLWRKVLAACGLLAFAVSAFAQDPSDLFLRAYQDFQAGEKFERDGSPREALARYENTAKLLEQIVRADATWQPPVVEYRLKKTRENIERLTAEVGKMPPVEEGPEGPLPLADSPMNIPPPAINTTTPLSPGRGTTSRPTSASPTSTGDSPALRKQLAEALKENERLKDKLARQAADLTSARFEIDRTKVTVVELKAQLAQAQDAFENVVKDNPKPPAVPVEDPRVAELTSRIAGIEADNEVLLEENDRLLTKLESASKYIEASDQARKSLDEDRSKVAKQRDEALAKTKRIKDNTAAIERLTAEKKELETKLEKASDSTVLEKLTAENKQLADRLAETEQKLTEVLKKPEENDKAMEALRSEINGLNDRLLEAYAQVTSRDDQIKALAKQLDEASGDLARVKLNPSPSPDDKRVMVENDLLRGIILRQIKEQGERDAARVELEKEIQALQVKSDKIGEKLGILAKPAFQLTDAESLMFRDPIALVVEPNASSLDVSVAISKPGTGEAAPAPQGAESLPEPTRDMVEEARKLFDLGRFADAEKLYQQIVEAAPDNYFALSNLGVTQIQSRKLSAAEVALRKAVTINPQDSFAATNLGIVYCKQGRFDDAIAALREAIAADENDHVAHNYLGVALGEKGLKSEAEEQLKSSVAIKSSYADAHFNLAVLYATSEPPSKELARDHYNKAISNGAPADPSLERMIQ